MWGPGTQEALVSCGIGPGRSAPLALLALLIARDSYDAARRRERARKETRETDQRNQRAEAMIELPAIAYRAPIPLAEHSEEHRPHVRAVAYRMLGSVSEAEDAVQEAWIRLSRTDVSAPLFRARLQY
jgi:hypothetical protein